MYILYASRYVCVCALGNDGRDRETSGTLDQHRYVFAINAGYLAFALWLEVKHLPSGKNDAAPGAVCRGSFGIQLRWSAVRTPQSVEKTQMMWGLSQVTDRTHRF